LEYKLQQYTVSLVTTEWKEGIPSKYIKLRGALAFFSSRANQLDIQSHPEFVSEYREKWNYLLHITADQGKLIWRERNAKEAAYWRNQFFKLQCSIRDHEQYIKEAIGHPVLN
jgi:hypothetical protein